MYISVIIRNCKLELYRIKHLVDKRFKDMTIHVHNLIACLHFYWSHEIGRLIGSIRNALFHGIDGETYLIEVVVLSNLWITRQRTENIDVTSYFVTIFHTIRIFEYIIHLFLCCCYCVTACHHILTQGLQ